MTFLALTLSLALQATPSAKAQPAKPMTPPSTAPAAEDLVTSTRAWHEQRIKSLTAEDSWLSLVGLFWLDEGAQSAGSAPDAKVVFPGAAPAKVGTFTRKGSTVGFQPAPGVTVTRDGKPFPGGELQTDEKGKPDVLKLGTVTFTVIQRGDKLGVRMKDPEAPTRKQFKGIETYAPNAAWRVEARYEKSETPRKLSVPNVLGTTEEVEVKGTLVFTVNGKEYRLTPLEEEQEFFIIFADETNRDTTYGAGRFLSADMPKDGGRVVLDFNRAYNPPCAFTHFATCPLPPRGNRLAVRVEAGEKRFGDH